MAFHSSKTLDADCRHKTDNELARVGEGVALTDGGNVPQES